MPRSASTRWAARWRSTRRAARSTRAVSVEASGGSFGAARAQFAVRRRIASTSTGSPPGTSATMTAWADHNPSRVGQFFGKVGFQDDRTDLDVSLTLADNTLQGTQTLPLSFLSTRRSRRTRSRTRTRTSLRPSLRRAAVSSPTTHCSAATPITATTATANVSSNVNDNFGESDSRGDAPPNEAINDVSSIDQKSWGFGAQLTLQANDRRRQAPVPGRRKRRLRRHALRSSTQQTADFTIDRGTLATGPFGSLTDVALRNALRRALLQRHDGARRAVDAHRRRPLRTVRVSRPRIAAARTRR